MKAFFRWTMKAFLIFIIIVAIILLSLFGYVKYQEYKLKKEFEKTVFDYTEHAGTLMPEDMEEELWDIDVNDDGMTYGEKVELGLDPYEWDSSGNGISDYDAIHKYNLDPTVYSSADDGISDLVKIMEGLDPHEPITNIEPFVIEDEGLGVTLHTTNLNDKYYAFIEPYYNSKFNQMFNPLQTPVRVLGYDGQITISYSDSEEDKEKITAYYFHFEDRKLIKIDNQEHNQDLNEISFSFNLRYPILLLADDEAHKKEFLYFRFSGFELTERFLGWGHKVYIFEVQGKNSDEYMVETIPNEEWGVAELSFQRIGKISANTVQGLFSKLDSNFVKMPEDNPLRKGGFIDYGQVHGNYDLALETAIPWIHDAPEHENEEIKDEDESESEYNDLYPDQLVIDSGFRIDYHAFSFSNISTIKGSSGICAGFARVAERIYNGASIEEKLDFSASSFLIKLNEKLNPNVDYDDIGYDLTNKKDMYPFLQDGHLYAYQLNDTTIEMQYNPNEKVDPDKTPEPDSTLVSMLETQWIHANDLRLRWPEFHANRVTVLDEIEQLFQNGQIITVSLPGHALNGYKMRKDEFDPNVLYIYLYDNVLPKETMENYGYDEVYMKIEKAVKPRLFDWDFTGEYHYFTYEYFPIPEFNHSYRFGEKDVEYTGKVVFYHNDKQIK
ncbi:hypothetical protein [Alkalihalobacterium bogoriense]|uniref:hypothetical protein n=1 Tax=Alkalihalobacterium bogoriense TaxID=246272 RepID=UPI0004795830|nr:hypothetical protein [Alkalihalobacterium bogoriense]